MRNTLLQRRCRTELLVIGLVALAGGCPDGQEAAPDAALDQGGLLNEAGLAFCSRPGAYCTPADPCGLNPRCGFDFLCLPDGTRDCDDGVVCTKDTCIAGGCEHRVTSGSCLIDAVCYAENETQGCGRCDPAERPTQWTPLDGVTCDDRNPCTLNDRCRQGMCVGQAYNCSDGLFCTTDACDGKGGCLHHLKPDFCQIEKGCYRHGETNATGCLICDVDISQHEWQQRVNICTIKDHCYGAGAKDPTNCFSCEPLQTSDDWTPIPDQCLIGQKCIQQDSLHPSKCAICDPKKNKEGWTPLLGAFLWAVAFSKSLEGFSASPIDNGVGWQLSQARFTSQPASMYYGNLATHTYDNGKPNSGVVTSPALTFLPQLGSYLSFNLYMDTEKSNNYDIFAVRVNGVPMWVKSNLTMSHVDYGRWINVLVDLGAWAGQTVKIVFEFDTNDDTNNAFEGVYIDDVTVMTGCPPAA